MINKLDAKKILDIALQTGSDYAEIFMDDTKNRFVLLNGNEITDFVVSNSYGASVRIISDQQEVFGYTNNIDADELKNLASRLSMGIEGKNHFSFSLEEVEIGKNHLAKESWSNEKVVSLLKEINTYVRSLYKEISQVNVFIDEARRKIAVYNSDGKSTYEEKSLVRFFVTVIASNGKENQTSTESYGGNCGYELFDIDKCKQLAKKAADSAVKMLYSKEMIGGKYTVVLNNGFGGVILHEACVHGLEASSVSKGMSVFCGKLGKKIASDIVTAIDDGTIENGWGSCNFDDEGEKTKRNVLIENGVLKSYLVDRKNTKIMNHKLTGSGRRQNYRLRPTSRMNNTYIDNGKSTFEEIIKSTKYGFFASKMGGGSVNPVTGEFNFSVLEGYMIENGEITYPVRGAALVGKGNEVLMNIDMVGNDLAFGYGTCGAASGQIPVIVGQPTIRVTNMTVGGRGEK